MRTSIQVYENLYIIPKIDYLNHSYKSLKVFHPINNSSLYLFLQSKLYKEHAVMKDKKY